MKIRSIHKLLSYTFVVYLLGGFLVLHSQNTTIYVKLKKSTSFSKQTLLNSLQGKYHLKSMPQPVKWVSKELPNIYQITDNHSDTLIQTLRLDDRIEWVDQNYSLKVLAEHSPGYDSLRQNQWYWHEVGGEWFVNHFEAGDSIIVAVIDTGIDWHHPDLKNSLWINYPEDLDGDGQLTEKDINNIDDDGNGIIDDVIGFDFTDSPELPAAGDYLIPDPFPEDEYGNWGHGTPVSGIIAAKTGNGIGISGLSTARIMTLKAGNSDGYLQADDVIKSLFYAVENGANVINMSFGDTYDSPFLHEVLRYADSHGVFLVAAAGNNSSDIPVYPAAWDEVIAVSSIGPHKSISPFSSYGNWVTVTAPGENILSTTVDSGYNRLQGTSFAAPIVTALVADILSLNESTIKDNIQLQQANLSNALDLGTQGKDPYYGYGMVQLPAISGAVNQDYRITFPVRNSILYDDNQAVVGSVWGELFKRFRVNVWQNENLVCQSSWRDEAVVSDTLANLNLVDMLPGIPSVLELEVEQWSQNTLRESISITKREKKPSIQSITIFEKIIGNQASPILVSELEFPEEMRVVLLNGQSEKILEKQHVASQHHYFEFRTSDWKQAAVYVGKETGAEEPDTIVPFQSAQYQLAELFDSGETLQETGGQLLPEVLDENRNGYPEFIFSETSKDTAFGPLRMVEFLPDSQSVFRELANSKIPFIPIAAKDLNNDGIREILCGYGDKSYILTDLDGDGYPMETVWSDTNHAWPAGFISDPFSSETYLVLRKENVYRLFTVSDKFIVKEVASLSIGNDNTVYSKPIVYPMRYHGETYLVFGDYYGHLYFFKFVAPGMPEYQFEISTQITNVGDFACVSDFNSDESDEMYLFHLVMDTKQSDESLNRAFTELLELTLSGSSVMIKPLLFFSAYGLGSRFFKGLNRIDNYLVLSASPFQFWLKFEQNTFVPTFYRSQMNSNIVLPFVCGASRYMAASSSVGLKVDKTDFLERSNAITRRNLVQISDSTVQALWDLQKQNGDSVRILMHYEGSLIADSIFKNSGHMDIIHVFQPDKTVQMELQLIKNNFVTQQFRDSLTIIEKPTIKAEVIHSNPLHIQISTNHILQKKSEIPENFMVQSKLWNPSYVFLSETGKQLNIFWESPLKQNDTLFISNLMFQEGYSLSAQVGIQPVPDKKSEFYPQESTFIDRKTIEVLFNAPLKFDQYLSSDHIQLMPEVEISDFEIDSQNPFALRLHLNPQNRLGGYGYRGVVKIRGIIAETGMMMDNDRFISLPVSYTVQTLEEAVVFPNPLKLSESDQLTIARIPKGTAIKIWSLNGELMYSRNMNSEDGFYSINLNKELPAMPSGVYIIGLWYRDQKKMVKLFYIK